MSDHELLLLEPGTLWTNILQRTEQALRCGALESMPTAHEWVEQGGIQFLVRILANLERKETAKRQQAQRSSFNPFLPYEEELFVHFISPTHLCLLNKYNVVEHHLLIVTRAFESQDCLLNHQDFVALWACMAEVDGLGFYNGGARAGASQPHKHLQLVPLPMVPDGATIPIEPAIAAAELQDGIGTSPLLPFPHAIAHLAFSEPIHPIQAAHITLPLYQAALAAVGLNGDPDATQPPAYNLLMTRRWLLVVPRSQEGSQGISVNSLGFAGALLVRNAEQMAHLKAIGPMTLLQQVAG